MLHNALLQRIRAEFLEMPGMRLKPGQVQRLCGIEGAACQMVLDLLVDGGLATMLMPASGFGDPWRK